MDLLTVKDCLLPATARVLEDARPDASYEHAVFAVFSESTQDGVFCGLATTAEIVRHPNWIFADLSRQRPLFSLTPDTTVAQALELMDQELFDAFPVLDDEEFVGVVTRGSIQQALCCQDRAMLRESNRLFQLASQDHKKLMEWSTRLSQLHAASRALLNVLAHTSLETEVLQAGIEALAQLLQARYGAIGLLDETGALKNFIHTGIGAELAQKMGRLPQGHGLLGVVVKENTPLRLDDMSKDPRSAGFPAHHPPMKSLLAVPVSRGERVFGRIYLSDKLNDEPFNADDEMLAQSFSNSLSLVLDNARELEEIKRAHRNLDHMAHFNALTDLPNRALFSDRLSQALLANLAPVTLAVMLIDLDHFNVINDTLGHAQGDEVLKVIAQRLAACIKEGDTVAHLGGDEFAIILMGVNQAQHLNAICERILHVIAEPCHLPHQTVHINASIGLTVCPQDSNDATTLLKYADMALILAKESGRAISQFFSSEMNARSLERLSLENELRAAIRDDALQLHYQPLVDLQTGRISGLEALARWEHVNLGAISPARFIPVAEASGLIVDLGQWVLRRVAQDIRTWSDSGIVCPRVAVNVSPKQFRDPLLADKIEAVIKEMRIESGSLCLEITESVLMLDTAASIATLARLKELGVDLVLDDFGTGFSSLSYLKRFPFNKVKIDQSFVRDIVNNADDAAISKAIISMAQSLGIRVVAEGVETEAQCAYLSQNMCDEIQGFLFSKGLAAEQVAALMREQRCLPGHLLRFHKAERSLLLVDDEANILNALKRLLRRDNYQILTANSGAQGLEILAKNKIDVIVSDQRMPHMTGVEFLREAKNLYPDTVRIVLSGYTELQSITDAINEGAIYKFLTKPWDDEQLRGHIEEAFQRKQMADENRRLNLEVRTANLSLAAANRQMLDVIAQHGVIRPGNGGTN